MKNLLPARGKENPGVPASPDSAPIRLHIGGKIAHPDWKIFNIEPGPDVDHVGHCADLSRFPDDSILEIYASHVVEHLHHGTELPAALREFNRAMIPGGTLYVSVPDLDTLCRLFLDPELSMGQHFDVMRMMFGGQNGPADIHYVGLNKEILTAYLQDAGFADIVRVDNFGLFDDASTLVYKMPISLNLTARKPRAA